jgi:hypothetical protein
MSRTRSPSSFRAALAVLALLAAGPAAAQVNEARFRDYFLVGQFGEVCTMCEVAVLCTAGTVPPGSDVVPTGGDFTLYLVHTRTFWSQVSTIWEYFVSNFTSATLVDGHERPVTVYEVAGGTWLVPQQRTLRLSLEPARIAIDDGREIDRVGRRWQRSADGESLGYCSRLPLWDTIAVVDAKAPTGEQP